MTLSPAEYDWSKAEPREPALANTPETELRAQIAAGEAAEQQIAELQDAALGAEAQALRARVAFEDSPTSATLAEREITKQRAANARNAAQTAARDHEPTLAARTAAARELERRRLQPMIVSLKTFAEPFASRACALLHDLHQAVDALIDEIDHAVAERQRLHFAATTVGCKGTTGQHSREQVLRLIRDELARQHGEGQGPPEQVARMGRIKNWEASGLDIIETTLRFPRTKG